MPLNATARAYLTDLLKAVSDFHSNTAVRFNFATVGVEGSGDISNIGIPLLWDEAADAFLEFVANPDRADTTAYVIGDIVKPLVQDGNEYVCSIAGTSDSSEPTFATAAGAETADATVTWTARPAYAKDNASSSPLPNKSRICVTVGDAFGVGFNKKDTTLSATPVNMTVIFRGEAALINEGFDWGSVVVADQAEFLTALEAFDITIITNAEVVSPTYTS